MPQVPQFNREVKLNASSQPYIRADVNSDMFGNNISQANANLTSGLNNFVNVAKKLQYKIEDTKILENSNNLTKWEQDYLYDKENGYFYKTGKDAVNKSEEIMKSFDEYAAALKSQSRLTPLAQQKMDDIIQRKRTRILASVNNHDIQQTTNWANIESGKAIDNAIAGMIHARNNPEEMNIQLANGIQAVRWQGMTQNLDEDTILAMEKDYKSKALSSVLDTKLQEGDLSAGEFFESHKNNINSALHSKYIGAIKNEEIKYKAKSLANEFVLTSQSQEEAINKAEKIQDINLSDMTISRIKKHYSEQEQFNNLKEKEALNGFYSKALQVAQNGGSLSYDDIPEILEPKIKLSLMNYVNQNGQPQTDNQIWENLYDMRVNNAQNFASLDLYKYRGYLSESDFRHFLKEQENIKNVDFYSNIQDDDKMIQAALKTIGLNKNSAMPWGGDKKDIAFSEIKTFVREFEARKGRSISDSELQNFISDLGYKGTDGVPLYKEIEKGMREKTNFIKDVTNDFVYHAKKHNGQMPSNEEKEKIIKYRLEQKQEEKKTKAEQIISNHIGNAYIYRDISNTIPKPNEQRILTSFADNDIPAISKELGINLRVTSRYRNQKGSKHGEGRALDIGLAGLSNTDRIRVYEKILPHPKVQALGCSDPNILAHFSGNKKLVDERAYDRQHGTNHINHVHVTLYNDNDYTSQQNSNDGIYRI